MKYADHLISELTILRSLNINEQCPFIIKLIDSFKNDENVYFLMEYVRGSTLHYQLTNPLVQNNWQFYVVDVILALEYLHKGNVVYRDLKPENIIISIHDKGHVKLCDFGFAKRLGSKDAKTYTKCGTPSYIAPEIILGMGHSF